MCCEETETLDLPPAVIEVLAHYRQLVDERGWDWGDEQLPDFFRWARFSRLGPVFAAFAETSDWGKAIRSLIGADVPAGVVVVRIDEGGVVKTEVGPARPAIVGQSVPLDVIVDSAAAEEIPVIVAGQEIRLSAGGAAIVTVELDGADPTFTVVAGNQNLVVRNAARRCETAWLLLTADRCARWSITDSTGGAWFPDGVPQKWDVHHRPFFHGNEISVPVPAEELTVHCARGLEFERLTLQANPAAGQVERVECEPQRLFDPAAAGWYGGDLHIHLNYSGDLVCDPADAARMQRGEGLHLANLVAGNLSGSFVYDRELFEQTAGADLPGSSSESVARMGLEFRNDMLGHVHALGPSGPPSRYHTGHEGSDHSEDWPPNKVACQELRDLGATVGYAHPAFTPFDNGETDTFFANARTAEARELVADAALGVVDSVDLISPFNDEGAIFLYHRLLSCGLRLAATAGTDVFLSFSHGPGVASNPPGWGRVYAQLGGQKLSVTAFQDAIRAGRTVVTNGPWLTFEVNGHGPGTIISLQPGDPIEVRASVHGPGADRLTLVGPDGIIAECDPARPLHYRTTVDGPLWLAAIARGGSHPNTLDESVLAHTSAVYIDVAGQPVRRAADARWCLQLLDSLQQFAHKHGHFHPGTRAEHFGDLVAVLDQARAYYRDIVA